MNERLTKSIIMKETKNCPFCASIEIRCETSKVGEGWVCWCANCGAIGPNDLGWSGAVESWNLRRPMDKVMEHINNALKVIEE
jgi:hypothetical protein